MLRRIALPACAAALAMIATAPLVAGRASARPIGPGSGSLLDQLQSDNQILRAQLRVALAQREDLARGLDRIDQANDGSRDRRTARRIGWLIDDLRARTAVDQPWTIDGSGSSNLGYPAPPPTGSTYPPPLPPPSPSTGPGWTSPTPPPLGEPFVPPPGSIVIGDRRTH